MVRRRPQGACTLTMAHCRSPAVPGALLYRSPPVTPLQATCNLSGSPGIRHVTSPLRDSILLHSLMEARCSTMMLRQMAPLLPFDAINLLQRGLVVDGGGPALEPGRLACRSCWRPGNTRAQRRCPNWPIPFVPSLDAGRELVLGLRNVTVGALFIPAPSRAWTIRVRGPDTSQTYGRDIGPIARSPSAVDESQPEPPALHRISCDRNRVETHRKNSHLFHPFSVVSYALQALHLVLHKRHSGLLCPVQQAVSDAPLAAAGTISKRNNTAAGMGPVDCSALLAYSGIAIFISHAQQQVCRRRERAADVAMTV